MPMTATMAPYTLFILDDDNTDLVEMRKGRSVEDLDRQRMAELETAFEQSAEEEPEQGMEV